MLNSNSERAWFVLATIAAAASMGPNVKAAEPEAYCDLNVKKIYEGFELQLLNETNESRRRADDDKINKLSTEKTEAEIRRICKVGDIVNYKFDALIGRLCNFNKYIGNGVCFLTESRNNYSRTSDK